MEIIITIGDNNISVFLITIDVDLGKIYYVPNSVYTPLFVINDGIKSTTLGRVRKC